jgi:hypothetical protein
MVSPKNGKNIMSVEKTFDVSSLSNLKNPLLVLFVSGKDKYWVASYDVSNNRRSVHEFSPTPEGFDSALSFLEEKNKAC